jgi:hypothetical protein
LSRRRGQAVVEVLALAPVMAACTLGFAAGAGQLVAMARAEAALANAVAADAAGTSIHGAVNGRARLVSVTSDAIEIAVDAPLGEVRLTGRRV